MDDQLLQTFEGMTVKGIRAAMHFRQEDLAEELKVTSTSVHRWEVGISKPRPDHARRLSKLAREIQIGNITP